MENKMIGRKPEAAILQKALDSNEAELVAVIGRRRIGKTFLVRTMYAPQIVFELAGLQNGSTKKQLKNFYLLLQTYFGDDASTQAPEDWLTAFHLLGRILDKLPPTDQKKVLFFDELSWLDSRKSGFLEAFGNFWNTWASRRNIVVVICGSAASWMIQKVVNNRGGLHNRITQSIHLQPFTLDETEAFLKHRNINLDRYHILQLYMAMGGVPYYLKEVQPGQSATQNIEHICFSNNGILRNEFLKLYPALFENAESHINIIRALASNQIGLTRKAIVALAKMPDGGTTSRYLEELEQSGFITSYYPFGKTKRNIVYRLTDEYSLFYLNFIENHRNQGNDTWLHLSQTQHYKVWSGYAFESICLKHLTQIKQAMSISGIYTEASAFYSKKSELEPGIQIDLLLDRKDQVINLFEMKFYTETLVLDANDAADLREKIRVFKALTKTKKQVFLYVIATFGLKTNEHSLSIIDKWFDMNVLFSTSSEFRS
jgi:uncharacterized protein